MISAHLLSKSDDVAEDAVQMIERRLASWLPQPAGIQVVKASESLAVPGDELRHVANASVKRRSEFIGGRWCAYRALEKIGTPVCGIPINALGGPVWPKGIIGSITHDGGICIAVVMNDVTIAGLGIDLFDAARSSKMDDLADLFLAAGERAAVQNSESRHLLAVLFSAKEAVIKAVSSRVERLIDFREIEVALESQEFTASICGIHDPIRGHYCDCGGFVLTMATLSKQGDRV